MPPTALNPTKRFIHPGTAKTYWVPTVASLSTGATRVELDAGTDLTGEIADMPGWMMSPQQAEVPDLGKRFVARVPGRINPADSQIVFWASSDTADVRDLLDDGDTGYIAILHGGDVVGQKYWLWPVTVNAVSPPVNVGGDAGRIIVDFVHTAEPARNLAIPA